MDEQACKTPLQNLSTILFRSATHLSPGDRLEYLSHLTPNRDKYRAVEDRKFLPTPIFQDSVILPCNEQGALKQLQISQLIHAVL